MTRPDLKTPLPRRQVVLRLASLVLGGALLAGCKSPPASDAWQEEYYRRKAKYREWGQGTSKNH